MYFNMEYIRSWECINTGNWYFHRHHNGVLKSNWRSQNLVAGTHNRKQRQSWKQGHGWQKRVEETFPLWEDPLLRRMEQEQQRGGLHLPGSCSHTNSFSFVLCKIDANLAKPGPGAACPGTEECVSGHLAQEEERPKPWWCMLRFFAHKV